MSASPKDLWMTLTPMLRRQIVDDLAAVLAEILREVGTGQANPLITSSVIMCQFAAVS